MEGRTDERETKTEWEVTIRARGRGPQGIRSLFWIIALIVLVLVLILLGVGPQIAVHVP